MASVKIGARKDPSGPGALASYPLLCSVCGPIGGSSLPAVARNVAHEHEDWHARQGK